jgi:hypothetical protein
MVIGARYRCDVDRDVSYGEKAAILWRIGPKGFTPMTAPQDEPLTEINVAEIGKTASRT